MYHLRLIKGLSYDGAVTASRAAPDVFADDPDKVTAALNSGFFEEIRSVQVGHLDAQQLADMSESDLRKLASAVDADCSAESKDALVEAVAAAEVGVEPAAEVDAPLDEMKVDELRAYAKENGISLSGCSTKSEIRSKIYEAKADAAAAAEILQQSAPAQT